MNSNRKKISKRILWIIISTVSVFIYFLGLSTLGQYYRKSHPGKETPPREIELGEKWKFMRGDDSAWSAVAFDDSNWQDVYSDSLPGDYDGRAGWFRYHVPDSLFPKFTDAAFTLHHYGASEVFFDGERVAGFGKVSNEANSENPFDPQQSYRNARFSNAGPHVIAVKYSNLQNLHARVIDDRAGPGFIMTLTDSDFGLEQSGRIRTANILNGIVGAFLVTLALIHLLLFLFYRESKENLYYSLFAFSFGMIFLCTLFDRSTSSPTVERFVQPALLLFINPVIFLTLIIFVYRIYQQKFSGGVWMAVLAGTVGVSHVLFGWPNIFLYFSMIIWYAVFCIFIMSRTTISAIREKRPGARILGTGVSLFTLLLIFVISAMFFKGRVNFGIGLTSTFTLTFIVVALLSIPISMSIYLAYNFSLVNRNLLQKLQEVETLSARSLEQEKEKQRILETQKETLEMQVKERTHEIEEQKREIEEKNKDITDSIKYAKRLQEVILPP
ncbi:MAG TPA: 7TM diverse intracellular signaling domain-containing protein, partial [Bacteroidia bacterium]